MIGFDAIVLAGGDGHRLGGADKPAVLIGGISLLDRVLAAVGEAERIVVVGPRRDTATAVVWAREEPWGSGPVSAIAAGIERVAATLTVVLAADLPWIAPGVPALLDLLDRHAERDVATLDDNPLIAAWRTPALRRAVAAIPQWSGAAARSLLAGVPRVDADGPAAWSEDCDTWADVEAARGRLTG